MCYTTFDYISVLHTEAIFIAVCAGVGNSTDAWEAPIKLRGVNRWVKVIYL